MKLIAALDAWLAFAKRNRRYLLMPVAAFCLYMVCLDREPALFWGLAWGITCSYSFTDYNS
jgi:hypothetical protein